MKQLLIGLTFLMAINSFSSETANVQFNKVYKGEASESHMRLVYVGMGGGEYRTFTELEALGVERQAQKDAIWECEMDGNVSCLIHETSRGTCNEFIEQRDGYNVYRGYSCEASAVVSGYK